MVVLRGEQRAEQRAAASREQQREASSSEQAASEQAASEQVAPSSEQEREASSEKRPGNRVRAGSARPIALWGWATIFLAGRIPPVVPAACRGYI